MAPQSHNQNYTIIKAPKWVMTIITTCFGAAIVGGGAYLFTVIAWAGEIQIKVASLEKAPSQIQEIREDMSAIKTDMANMKNSIDRLDAKQDKVIDKLGSMTRRDAVVERGNYVQYH